MINSGKFPLLSEVVNNAVNIDSDELHIHIIKDIKAGKYETCLEALADYAQRADNYEELARLISPVLRAIIQKEAQDKMLLKEFKNPYVGDFF